METERNQLSPEAGDEDGALPLEDDDGSEAAVRELAGPVVRCVSWLGDRLTPLLCRLCRVQIVCPSAFGDRFGQGPMIIVANHRSLVDTPVLRHVLPPAVRARTATMGARDFFAPAESDKGIRWFVRWLRCRCIVLGYRVCLIGRTGEVGDGAPKIVALLRAGYNVVLFPEGTRTRTGELGRFRIGVSHVARLTRAAVLPVWIEGTERVLPVGASGLHAGVIRVIPGAPLRIGESESNHEFLARVRVAIESLGGMTAAVTAFGGD